MSTQSVLPAELHAATREEHQLLNRLIIARLPLCLPPHTHSPLLYAKGMVVFGQIYLSFERALDDLLASDDLPEQIRLILQTLQTPKLRRTERLAADLQEMRDSLHSQAIRELEQLHNISQSFGLRISQSISSNPHVLLAYTWTMYLALFNGGRWISKQLRNAGDGFWLDQKPSLSFWEFPGEEEGEDIKISFKQNFDEAASRLTEDERRDVVEESKKLFKMCSEMVLFLDQQIDPSSVNEENTVQPHAWLGTGLSPLLSVWQVFVRSCTLWRRPVITTLVTKEVRIE